MMKCPLCSGTFMVPALPSSAAAGAPAGQGPGPFTPPTPPPPPPVSPGNAVSTTPPPPQPSAPPSPPPAPGTFTGSYTLRLNPRIVQWLMPGAALLVLVLTFFPWYGLYPSCTGVYTQNAWQAAFGGGSEYDIWTKYSSRVTKRGTIDSDKVGANVPLVFYLLIFLLGLVLACVLVLFNLRLIPAAIPPALRDVWPWRTVIVGGLFLLAFILLVMQLLVGFSLNHYVRGLAQDRVTREMDPPITEEDREMIALAEDLTVATFNPGTSFWFKLAFLLNLVILAGAGLEYWLERRGAKPLPQLEARW